MLNAINYTHWGAPKMWYAVPESDRQQFERACKEKKALLFKEDPNLLHGVVTMMSPTYLMSQGVRVLKTL
jgi:histone demethylase JARID1